MEGKFVLIADDDQFAQNVLGMLCKTLKVEHSIHGDGNQVFDAYKAKNGSCSLVLMDIHMPGCDGFEATKKIRAFEAEKGLSKCKIIGISGDDDIEKDCKNAGMDGSISKPITPPKLQALLN